MIAGYIFSDGNIKLDGAVTVPSMDEIDVVITASHVSH